MTCGLPGSGKTTVARAVERERGAVVLNGDDWILRLFPAPPDDHRAEHRPRVEQLQRELAAELLEHGVDVVIDHGVWQRVERDELRELAQRAGADCVLIYCDVELDELKRRVAERQTRDAEGFLITPEQIDEWATWFEAPTSDENYISARSRFQ